MIRFPQTEGRAANLDFIDIYKDPFIIYIYLSSISFFIALYQAIKLLTFIDAGKAFSPSAVNALKNIKFATVSFIGFIAIALFYIRFFVHGDDSAGPTALGIIVMLFSGIVAAAAGVFQKLVKNKIGLKSENEKLTAKL